MAIKSQLQTIDYSTILQNTTIAERAALVTSRSGQQLLSAMNPTELANLFPSYYLRNNKAVSNFITSRTRGGQGQGSGQGEGSGTAAPPSNARTGAENRLGPTGGGVGRGYEDSGLSRAQIIAFIRQEATKRGIDPNVAVRVAQSEGLNTYQSTVIRNGVRERSYGPFQLYMGGGLGNAFMRDTGINPETDRSERSIRMQIQYALDTAAKQRSWTARDSQTGARLATWYGPGNQGIGPNEGFSDQTVSIGYNENATIPTAAAEPVEPGSRPDGSAGLVMPVSGVIANPNLRTGYGAARPGGRPHSGIDFGARNGSTVVSMQDGEVLHVVPSGSEGYGAQAIIRHGNTIRRYATHGTVTVRPGDRVAAGQPIGTIGRGHLHLEEINSTRPDGSANPVFEQFLRNGNASTSWQNGTTDPLGPQGSLRGIVRGSSVVAGAPAFADQSRPATAQTNQQNQDPTGLVGEQPQPMVFTTGANNQIRTAEIIRQRHGENAQILDMNNISGITTAIRNGQTVQLFSGAGNASNIDQIIASLKSARDNENNPLYTDDQIKQMIRNQTRIVEPFGTGLSRHIDSGYVNPQNVFVGNRPETGVGLRDYGAQRSTSRNHLDAAATTQGRRADIPELATPIMEAADGGTIRGIENPDDLTATPMDAGRDNTLLMNNGEPVAKVNTNEQFTYDSQKKELQVTPRDRSNAMELAQERVDKNENYQERLQAAPQAAQNVMKDTPPPNYSSERDWVEPPVPTNFAMNDSMQRVIARNNFKEIGEHFSHGAVNFK